ncbi:hypothetical protein O7614_26865 [Micromonospora sp. WMMD961]|uniref:deoxynucleotide monophosphate kinase family protein n=1 Tax=Micromonospora sp. WMMD961 TaxID=3016100 RepID=UPI00241727FB|nr:hypothetical protein [Micromonospora sp. WMMD961]MDG4783285.1 hypothetical protein [Micromonospora sp. WMMD961]
MARPLVGLLGRSRAGKDTVGARLVERHGYVRYAFGDNVRRLALAIDPLVDVSFDGERLGELVNACGWESAKQFPEVRRFLQRLATEAVREIDPYFWIRPVMDDVEADIRGVVITDVRFHNEAEAIRRAGGLLVRVIRPDLPPDPHVSENELLDRATDYEIRNDAGLDFLTGQTDWLAGLISRRFGK